MNSAKQENTVVVFSTRYIDNKDSYLFAKSEYFEGAMTKLLELDYFKKKVVSECMVYWRQIYNSNDTKADRLTYSEICQKLQIENAELKKGVVDCLLSSYIEECISEDKKDQSTREEINEEINNIGPSKIKFNHPMDYRKLALYYTINNEENKCSDIKEKWKEAYREGALSSYKILVEPDCRNNASLMKLLEASIFQTIGMRKLPSDAPVYAIHALSEPIKDWIKTLYSIATEKCTAGTNEEDIKVILILHDKDVSDSEFHRDFYVASKEEVNTLYGGKINTEDAERLTIAFYMHTSNPIVEILTKQFETNRNIVDEVKIAIDKNVRIQECLKSISTVYRSNHKEAIGGPSDKLKVLDELKKLVKELDNLNHKKSL